MPLSFCPISHLYCLLRRLTALMLLLFGPYMLTMCTYYVKCGITYYQVLFYYIGSQCHYGPTYTKQ
ncbi:hypothetical protein FIBSPDRAFT_32213 [Athelia psychrophila]|uniref:Uncharacterized protein n=1 Tax=Athelia psychrophila TaxID=1759441 RepID=A0A166FY29_9AGAM|nr:hypothetical protein FIBSPDRAFT_32213 [Fibularhizoctonia sp. CBS 109695]